MRWSLVLFWVYISYRLLATEAVAQTPTPVPMRPWPDSVTGYGKTIEGAKKDALEQTLREIREFLKNLDPPIVAWEPSEDYLRTQIFQGPGQMGPDLDIPEVGPIKAWTIPLQPPTASELQRWSRLDQDRRVRQSQEIRRGRGEERAKEGGRIFACVWLALSGFFLHHQLRTWFPDRRWRGLPYLMGMTVLASCFGVWWLT